VTARSIRQLDGFNRWLIASVWSRDVDRAMNVARGVEAARAWINSHGTGAINHLAPHGGVKQSGIGRKSASRKSANICRAKSSRRINADAGGFFNVWRRRLRRSTPPSLSVAGRMEHWHE
jgi:hypothetical protein